MGKISRASLVTITSLLSLALLITTCSTLVGAEETSFVDCLTDNAHPSYPIINNASSVVVYTPNNASYETVLDTYIRNLRFNTSSTPKPLAIITALHVSHVQASIVCAKEHDLELKIRSGGHDFEGQSYWSTSPFFILDMFNLRSIDVDVGNETAWVQAGATIGEVYYGIANKSKVHGFPAGVATTVGVGGHFSGGGYGNMMRKYGLSVDNIVDAHIIDVNGRLLDRASMGEDLFWAIRGGGAASFAVILAYKINLVRVPQTVTVFQVARTTEENALDIVYQYEQVSPYIDDNLFIRLTMDVVNSTNPSAGKIVRATFIAMFLGNSSALLPIIEDSFPLLGLNRSDCIEMSWVESTLFYTGYPIGTPVDTLLSRTPQVLTHFKRKSDYIKTPIPKQGLELIWKRMIELETPALTFNPYGGKMAEIAANATPFPHRARNLFKVMYATNWDQDGDEATVYYLNLTRKLYACMTPFVSRNPREAFLNYRDLDIGITHNGNGSYLEGRVYGAKYYKGNFDRLVEVKSRVDPDNFFRNEQSIPVLPKSSK